MRDDKAVLVTYNLTRTYGAVKALDNVTLTVHKGDIYGLVGRNGAGKTTLLRLISGQSIPTSGDLELFGTAGHGAFKHRNRTGVIIETPSFYPYLTARENLEYYRMQRGLPGKGLVEEALERVHLQDTGKKKFKSFSLGMKQRLGLALALMNRPDFLLLDEPINGLDPEGVAEFRTLMKELNRDHGTTILISSHILTELASIATCYGFLEQGKLLEEITAEALHEKCRTCLLASVDNAPKAATILETALGCSSYDVLPGNVLQIYAFLDAPQKVSAALSQGGVALYGLEQKGMDLENYFLQLIGGEQHV